MYAQSTLVSLNIMLIFLSKLLYTELRLWTVCAGKVYGALNLIMNTRQAALSVVQLFSSLAAFNGAAGQASYAAANGSVDAIAQYICGQGRTGFAVQWGNWGGGGMAVRNKGFIERMERMGLGIGMCRATGNGAECILAA